MANAKIQFKRGKKATWEQKNPILDYGEPGYEKETGKLKMGDGIHRWKELPYVTDGQGGDVVIDLNIQNGEGENSLVQEILDVDASFPVPSFEHSKNEALNKILDEAWLKLTNAHTTQDNEFIAGAFDKAALAANGKSQAVGSRSSAFGSRTVAYGSGSFATGNSTLAQGSYSHTEGAYTVATSTGAHAEGQYTLANGESSHAEGVATQAGGPGAHAEGINTKATGSHSHAEGFGTSASGDITHAEGEDTQAIGRSAHAEGGSTKADANYTHAEGYGTVAGGFKQDAQGNYLNSEGQITTDSTAYIASGVYAHAEGANTLAIGDASHAEGLGAKALAASSHAEGDSSIATGRGAHAEGYICEAEGRQAHAEGYRTFAKGNDSHAEGSLTQALSDNSHAEGHNCIAGVITENGVSIAAHAGGYNTTALAGIGAFVHGYSRFPFIASTANTFYPIRFLHEWESSPGMAVSGEGTGAFGVDTAALGVAAFATGNNNVAAAKASCALNAYNKILAQASTVTGGYNSSGFMGGVIESPNIEIDYENYLITLYISNPSLANIGKVEIPAVLYLSKSTSANPDMMFEGLFVVSQTSNSITLQCPSTMDFTALSANYATYSKRRLYLSDNFGITEDTTCWKHSGMYNLVGGYHNISGLSPQFVHGYYNTIDYNGDYALMLGNGDEENRSNAMAVTYTGEIQTSSNLASGGADYAEYFEWDDGNATNEDRVGYIVALDKDKIRFANSTDDVFGIISGTAGVIGDNAAWEWKQKYQTDEFGRVIWDRVDKFVETVDEEGNIQQELIGTLPQRRLNPNYDPAKTYKSRADRPEWDCVGLIGKLHVRDDGTCVPGGYAKVGEPGIATLSTEKTNMRVMKRISDNIVLVFMK